MLATKDLMHRLYNAVPAGWHTLGQIMALVRDCNRHSLASLTHVCFCKVTKTQSLPLKRTTRSSMVQFQAAKLSTKTQRNHPPRHHNFFGESALATGVTEVRADQSKGDEKERINKN